MGLFRDLFENQYFHCEIPENMDEAHISFCSQNFVEKQVQVRSKDDICPVETTQNMFCMEFRSCCKGTPPQSISFMDKLEVIAFGCEMMKKQVCRE